MMFRDLEHPEIGWIERTGYPSWMQEETEVLNDEDDEDVIDDDDGDDYCDFDEDRAYEERREQELFGD